MVVYQAIKRLPITSQLSSTDKNSSNCSSNLKSPIKRSDQEQTFVESRARKSSLVLKPVDIRQTFSSVLRECARVTSDKLKEAKILRQLTEGGSDPSTISRLEKRRKQEERMQEMKKMQEKHLKTLLSREDVILAKKLSLNDTKLQAEKVRKEKQELHEKLKKLRQYRSREMTKMVERCHAMEQTTREACNSMADEKRKRAAEIVEESRRLKLRLAKQREEEEKKRNRLIQEIKAVQKTRLNSIKDYDPTESSGLGFLCEMSLMELKENLLSMKVRRDEEIERRNTVIRRERERKKNLMENSQRLLEQHKAINHHSSFARKLG